MALQFSIYAFVYIAMGIITLLLAIYSWKRRAVTGHTLVFSPDACCCGMVPDIRPRAAGR